MSKDTARDFILTAKQPRDYGAIDEIITSRKLDVEAAGAPAPIHLT